MHFCHQSKKTVTGPICARIVALYLQNSQAKSNIELSVILES